MFWRAPLRQLYLAGPAWLGCWMGQAWEDICAQLSNVSSSFWVGQMDECRAMVEKRLMAFVVTVECGAYVLLAWHCLSGCITHVTVVRPLVRELRHKNGALDIKT